MEEKITAAANSWVPNTDAATEYIDDKIEKLPLTELLKRIGPGLILTGIVIGPGAITTAAMIGSNYGYALIWLMFPIAFMGITFVLTTYRIASLTGLPIIHAIRKFYGKGVAAFVGVCLFIACFFFTIGNISGTGAGISLITGINWKLGAIIMIAILVYCYFAKGVYSKIEKAITVCIAAMIIAFYYTLAGIGGPEAGSLFTGLVHWGFPEGSVVTALGFISTNAAITTGIYGTYLGAEKKWKKEDMFNGIMFTDAVVHIVGVCLITGAIVLVGAIVLHPTGQVLQNPVQMAAMLVPALGRAASIVMGVALLGAGYSSLLGNTQRAMVLLNAGLDKPVNLEHKSIQWGSMGILLVCCLICFSYSGSPVMLIYIANVLTAIATPVAGFFVCLLLCRKDVNKGFRPPRLLQVSMIFSYLFCLLLTWLALSKSVPQLVGAVRALL